jgi:hypothetical protein
MFWVALAVQCAGETHVTAKRIVAALLRTDSVREFCSGAKIDSERVMDALEDSDTLSFAECERRVRSELAANGLELGSKEHQDTVQRRPLDPAVRGVFDRMIERYGHIGLSPLELLLDIIRADPALAERLAPHGLNAEAIRAAIGPS